jgi:hypothetical protein
VKTAGSSNPDGVAVIPQRQLPIPNSNSQGERFEKWGQIRHVFHPRNIS